MIKAHQISYQHKPFIFWIRWMFIWNMVNFWQL
jgi:hypothetical protein